MPARFIAAICLMAILSSVAFTAAPVVEKPAAEDSITVTVVGTLRTSIAAIGGETTGTTITAKRITWELDFGKNAEFRKTAEKLNGKKVVVQGSLERRRGVEIKERWIVTVTGLSGYEKDGTGAKLGVGAVEPPGQVQAKVLYSTADEKQQRADIDLWISKAVAKAGSPVALPHTGWIALTGDNQRLYEGRFYIDGKAIERGGSYKVEIVGCDGGPLDKTVMLKPGERRVVKLTNNPAPNNVFIALEAPVSKQAKKRTEAMKASAKTFRLELSYNGDEDKPFYRMIVSVPVINRRRNSPFNRIVQVKEDEAIRIIDHLARDGFFDRAHISGKLEKLPQPCYLLTVHAGDLDLTEIMGWGLPMIHRLDALRNALPGNGKKDMDLVLGRLSGWRKKWEAENPPFVAKVDREDSRIQFAAEGGSTIIDIASKFGIDKASIRRESPTWPKTIIVRLHLSGLELFNVGNGEISVDWSVSSTGDNTSRVFLRSGADETALDTKSPYHTPVRIVRGNGKIPLKDGYFEVVLPAKLLEKNPEEITLEWIDFYRN